MHKKAYQFPNTSQSNRQNRKEELKATSKSSQHIPYP